MFYPKTQKGATRLSILRFYYSVQTNTNSKIYLFSDHKAMMIKMNVINMGSELIISILLELQNLKSGSFLKTHGPSLCRSF